MLRKGKYYTLYDYAGLRVFMHNEDVSDSRYMQRCIKLLPKIHEKKF